MQTHQVHQHLYTSSIDPLTSINTLIQCSLRSLLWIKVVFVSGYIQLIHLISFQFILLFLYFILLFFWFTSFLLILLIFIVFESILYQIFQSLEPRKNKDANPNEINSNNNNNNNNNKNNNIIFYSLNNKNLLIHKLTVSEIQCLNIWLCCVIIYFYVFSFYRWYDSFFLLVYNLFIIKSHNKKHFGFGNFLYENISYSHICNRMPFCLKVKTS